MVFDLLWEGFEPSVEATLQIFWDPWYLGKLKISISGGGRRLEFASMFFETEALYSH